MVNDYRTDLLGGRDQQLRLPVLGNIRPGIKRLKKDCTDTDKAIYESMVKQGAMWHEIDARLGLDARGKTKLIPGNEDYFTVRPADCRTNPDNARILHELYQDEDGQIRHFPLVFLSNDWFECIPHELTCWTARELKYRSKYKPVVDRETGETGFVRVCMSPVPYKKGVRPFGGRDYTETRPCDPQTCTDYQKGFCKIRGHVQCIIPGTRGAGVWNIETGSVYSFLQMKSQMEMVQRITHRLQGLINEKTGQPVFWLRKVTDSISRVDVDKGESTRTEQDLIYLEADIDMYELITNYQPQAVLARGKEAQAILNNNPPHPDDREKKPYGIRHDPPPAKEEPAQQQTGQDTEEEELWPGEIDPSNGAEVGDIGGAQADAEPVPEDDMTKRARLIKRINAARPKVSNADYQRYKNDNQINVNTSPIDAIELYAAGLENLAAGSLV
jgi:hypothetical protein